MAWKIIKYFFAIVFILIVSIILYIKIFLPNVGPAPTLEINANDSIIKHGEYLANHVTTCIDCHSWRNWDYFSGPVLSGTRGKGGEVFNSEFNFPGNYTSTNITPYALSSWTDGEIFHAITAGVNKNGKSLYPIMPHPNYGKLDSTDIIAIVAYLRTLKSIEHITEKSTSRFPMNILINTIPKKPNFVKRPNPANKIAYGEYIAKAASCKFCHTMGSKGILEEGMEYAGGLEFIVPSGGIVRSANITPDKETGIGSWTKEQFINKFASYNDSVYTPQKIVRGEFNSIMPWTMYAGMKLSDLEALYDYLNSLNPINNKVENFSATH